MLVGFKRAEYENIDLFSLRTFFARKLLRFGIFIPTVFSDKKKTLIKFTGFPSFKNRSRKKRQSKITAIVLHSILNWQIELSKCVMCLIHLGEGAGIPLAILIGWSKWFSTKITFLIIAAELTDQYLINTLTCW